jgi:hypothetical protein
VTFDATPPPATTPALDLSACEHMTVCDLTGVERFLVWAVRWCASQHDDDAFADLCLRDSFERANLAGCLPSFRRFVTMAHGDPAPCPPAARLGCWRINALEAITLHTVACLQGDRFGDAWRTLTSHCGRVDSARAMLALGELADALSAMEARVRPWDAPRRTEGTA